MQFSGPEALEGRQDWGVCKWGVGDFYSMAWVTLPATRQLKRDFNLLSSIRKWYHITLIAGW